MDKEAEVEKCLKAAKKASKSGFFKKPEWDLVATELDKAAQLLQAMKQQQRAIDVWLESSDAHYKAQNYYFAAKSLETAAKISQDMKDNKRAAELLERSAKIYEEDDKADKGADNLTRAAKLLMETDPDKATEMLNAAIDVFAETKKWHLSGDTFRLQICHQLKQQKWESAIATINRQFDAYDELKQPHNCYKGALECVIIWLYAGEEVKAERVYQAALARYDGFSMKEEGVAASKLMQAFEQRDPELLQECIGDQLYTFLTPEVYRMVKKLKVVGAPAASSATTSGIGGDGNAAKNNNNNNNESSDNADNADNNNDLPIKKEDVPSANLNELDEDNLA